MKKKLTVFEYLAYLVIETSVFLFLLSLITKLVLKLNPETSVLDMLLTPVIILGIMYFIIKVISQKFNDKPLFSMLPISYSFSFYLIQFRILLDHSTSSSDYTMQLALFTLFFIIVSSIDKIFNNYLKHSREK
ncbi:hypothetical protein MK407_07610 [Streptococcus sanguinis]|jgi:hypothetical protein|uniref:Uncharacterized protein n=1 Tax=Streptococcus sanguinis TaxID=1305 RepID=A0A5A7ZCJ9_STRSA|nr:hypothetical protein [Streptococcus sanguinis]KAA0113236.1 hypothetical protein FKX92_11915 [Streptococcus sanguinis]MCY7039078.1 hypothetical protein [Streptococcus sanguinis]